MPTSQTIKLNDRLVRLFLCILTGILGVILFLSFASRAAADTIPLNGVGAIQMAYNPVDQRVYVLNSNDSVSIVDGQQVIKTIDLPGGALSWLTDLKVAKNGDVYVSQWFFDQAFVLRGGQLLATLPRQTDNTLVRDGIENGPIALAANPLNGRMYVATDWEVDRATNGVDVISGTQVLAHVITGPSPRQILVSPSGRAYVANTLGQTVTILQPDGLSVFKQVDVGSAPLALAIDSSQNVYAIKAGSISVISGSTGNILAAINTTQTRPLAVYSDLQNGRIYISDLQDNRVTVVNTTSRTVEATLAVGKGPIAITGDPAAQRVYVANQVDGTVSVIQGTGVIKTLAVGRSPVALVYAPGTGVYVANYQDASLSIIAGEQVTATLTGLPRRTYTSLHTLPNGQVAAAGLSRNELSFLNGGALVTTTSFVENNFVFPFGHLPGQENLEEVWMVAHKPLAASQSGQVFVAYNRSQSVSRVDPQKGLIQSPIWVEDTPYDIAMVATTQGERLYVTTGNGGVNILNPQTGSIDHKLTQFGQARALAAWPEKKRVYIVRSPGVGQGSVSIIDNALPPTLIGQVDTCKGGSSIAIDRPRGWVYVVCSSDDRMAVISDTLLAGTVALGAYPQEVVVNPVNRYAYATSLLSNEVFVLDGLRVVARIPTPRLPFALDVDAQTGRVFVTCQQDDVVAVIEGIKLVATLPTGKYPDSVLVHPTNHHIYAGSAHSAQVDVFQYKPITIDHGAEWEQADTIQSGDYYIAPIDKKNDVDWYKIHLTYPGSTVTVTLGGMNVDYDLAFFNPLTKTETTTASLETLDLNTLAADGSLQSLGNWVDLGQLRTLPLRGGGVSALSARSRQSVEVLSDRIWEAGDYYIAVWGHNGAFNDYPYALRAEVTLPGTPTTPLVPVTPTSLPPAPDLTRKALILTHSGRLGTRFGATRAAELAGKLSQLAAATQGAILDLAAPGYADVAQAYALWDANPAAPQAANLAADVVKALLFKSLKTSYPNATMIVIVGDDSIIPFYRAPDLALVANERRYNAWVNGQSPMAARLHSGYLLSDNFYASNHPIPWRGTDLYIPEYALGRLVETPEEMGRMIQAYLDRNPSQPVTNALVSGYDFVKDTAAAIALAWNNQGVQVDQFIHDNWTAADLFGPLFSTHHDLLSLNGHFNHYLMVPASGTEYLSSAQVTNAAGAFSNALVLSIGCQSGLSVPDKDFLPGDTITRTKDFAQAFVGNGAAYIANTGYGYGDSNTISYSENLALKLVDKLSQTTPQPIGQALMRAKQDYISEVGYASFSEYDAKVLSEWTLYGLPMMMVQLPGSQAARAKLVTGDYEIFSAEPSTSTFITLPIKVIPSFNPVITPVGKYYQIDGDTQVSPGRPVQPRIAVTLPENQAFHGALLISATYQTVENFDPLVSRVVSDTHLSEPPFDFDHWYPFPMHVINRLQMGNQIVSQKLVVIPAQYRALTPTKGTERLYNMSQFYAYATPLGTSTDFTPPTIEQVDISLKTNGIWLSVTATDSSGVQRVVVTNDRGPDASGKGTWQSIDLMYNPGSGTWEGTGPSAMVNSFIQAVDTQGNVAISSNKGSFFAPAGMHVGAGSAYYTYSGQSVSLKHTLANQGGRKDTFLIQPPSVPDGWLLQTGSTLLEVSSGFTSTISMTLTIPQEHAPSITPVPLTTRIQSLGNPELISQVSDQVYVLAQLFLPFVRK